MTAGGVVGVFPVEEHARRPLLFRALEAAFGVSFEGRTGSECHGLDAAVVIGDAGSTEERLRAAGVPAFVVPVAVARRPAGPPVEVAFSAAGEVDARLRGRRLAEGRSPAAPLPAGDRGTVVATTREGPVWARHVEGGVVRHEVSSPLAELTPRERLKDLVAAGRFLSLLPLVQFLREVFEQRWQRPALRASFILDDPNLHWRSYGYLRYPELAAHAARHRYHVGIAMVPLDAVFAHPATVRLFRQSPQLSLLVHGNDHVKRELAQLLPPEQAVALLAQAMHRMSAFERRHRLTVCRVMVPPHYDCSEPMMAAMVRTGFEAVCYTGPVDTPPEALVGWAPADVHVGAGLPGLHRLPFDAPGDELVLRAFLDQPIVLYGHHTDLARGMDVLAEAADRVNGLGHVAWLPSADVARSNYLVHHDGSSTTVRPYCRRFAVTPPAGSERLRVELAPCAAGGEQQVRVVGAHGAEGASGAGLPVDGGVPLLVELAAPGEGTEHPPAMPGWRPWPVVRRCLTETRDRVSPLLGVEWSQRQVQ